MTDAFERSLSGQENRALFYGVNYTCYVEGGAADHERSVDMTFWREVLSAFRPDISFVFLPRGGKPILESLARDTIANDVGNVVVAMDTDYDRLTDDLIQDNRIIYTYGYSWENDVYDREFIASLITTISHQDGISEEDLTSINDIYDKFVSNIRLPMKADLAALLAGSSVLPRSAPGRIIKTCPISSSPITDKREVLNLIMVANSTTRPRTSLKVPSMPTDLRYLVGHCLSHATAIIIRAALRRMGIRKTISSDHLRDVALLAFGKRLGAYPQSAVAAHHASQCAMIPQAT